MESIGGILIPISGNPDICVCFYSRRLASKKVTCNYQAPKGQYRVCKTNEMENQVIWDLPSALSKTSSVTLRKTVKSISSAM